MNKSRFRALFAVLFFLVAACDDLPGRPNPADRPVNPIDVTNFDLLWGETCAGCHGADGRLGAARPLNDPIYLAMVSDADMREVIANGVPGTSMPGFLSSDGLGLSANQIDLVLAGMRARWAEEDALKGLNPPPYKAALYGDAEAGSEVFARACSSCHGPDGRGGSVRGSVVDPSYLALVSNQSLRSTVIFGRLDLAMPDWRGAGSGSHALLVREVRDVVAWLASHRIEFPGRPYSEEQAAHAVGRDANG